MMADEAAVDDARRVPALPQDHRVEIAFEGAAEIGRFARAKANIAAGEVVLMAAPFTTVFSPNTYVSALQLLCGAEAEVVGGGGVASNKKALPRGKAKATRHTDPATPSRSSMHLTHANTYCSCCFQPIPAGSALLNVAELKDLAVDVSIEQDEIDESLRCTEEQHLGEEGEHDVGADAPASVAAKRLKKPTKSAKMRSDTHVELQQRLRQKALDQRQVLMEEHRLKREAEPPRPPSCAVASFDECQAELATTSVVVGCEGCGIVCYCSKQCFQAYDAIHRGSGECCVLRRLFPIIMRHYYSPSTGARRRQGGGEEASAVLMPGEEPKRWGRNTGEEQCWEAQGILLAALVVMRRNLEGYATPPATPPPRDTRSCNDDVGTTTPVADAGTSTCRSSVVPGGVVESSALPAEVLAMQRTRRTLGLDKIVEVLEPNPARRSTEEPHPPPHANGEGYLPTHVEVVSGDGQRRSIRLPRYADIAEMVSNESVMTKDRSGLYARYYRKYCRLLAPISMGVAGISLHLPEYLFFRICAVAQCNSFGIYTPEDRSVGFSIYPEASYFNHSCLPNLCRVMTEGGRAAVFYALRPISAGEALTICYTDVQELDSSVRRINLLGTYRFYCGCERCAGSASLADGRVELCDRCAIKGYLRPLPSSASTLSVRLRCTICGHERMRTDFPRATQA